MSIVIHMCKFILLEVKGPLTLISFAYYPGVYTKINTREGGSFQVACVPRERETFISSKQCRSADDDRVACEKRQQSLCKWLCLSNYFKPLWFSPFLHFNQSVTVEWTLLGEAVSFARNFRYDTIATGVDSHANPVRTYRCTESARWRT